MCATRGSREDFFRKTALGRSLSLYNFPFVEIRLFENNSTALPILYNRAIDESKERPAIMVFCHDDVHLCSFYWPEHIYNALKVFEIVGLAGNKRRVANQPSWAFVDDKWTWDARENLSGLVGHGNGFPPENLIVFGPPCQEVKLLDGLMLICDSHILHTKNIRFDERFDFHFYDLDFCRQAEIQNVKMGTWNISVVHESKGHLGSAGWKSGYAKYLEKWHS